MAPVVVNYVPPPLWAAVLVVQRDARASTPFADHVLQSNAERRRYPDHGRPLLDWIPAAIRTDIRERERAWSLRHVD